MTDIVLFSLLGMGSVKEIMRGKLRWYYSMKSNIESNETAQALLKAKMQVNTACPFAG